MFGFIIPDWLKMAAGGLIGASIAVYPAILVGRHEGRQQAATAALSKSIDILRDRNEINDEVSASDSSALCAAMELSGDDQAECVRRLLSPDPEPGNVGDHP